MRKNVLLFAVFMMSSSLIFSQAFDKSVHGINVGIGLGNTGYIGAGYSGFIPSISASYEYGIVTIPMGSELTGVVSAGGFLGWSTAKYAWSHWNDVHYVYTTFIFGARGNYHFIFHDKLDTYAGVWLGYRLVNGNWTGSGQTPSDWSAHASSVSGGAYVGARWLFTDSFGVWAELGYLVSIMNFGVAFIIK